MDSYYFYILASPNNSKTPAVELRKDHVFTLQ